MDRIPVAGPSITDREVALVAEAAREAWYADAGVYNARFENDFADYVGRRHAVSLPSCTAGIHLALAAAGVGPGDEVVVPDLTWIASVAPVSYVGATPVFADVDPDSWCLNVETVEAVLTERTRAIIAVDLYGNLPALEALEALAAAHDLVLIEDAAEAVGSERAGRRAGSFGRFSVFSFHGSKTLTTGEGGMLLTDDADLHARVLFLRDHGRRPGDTSFQNTEVAFKYRMSALQAAMGIAQLERVEELVAMKRQLHAWYAERLAGEAGIALSPEIEDGRNSFWMVTLVTEPALRIDKFDLIEGLGEAGVDARPFFSPLSSLEAYAGTPAAALARQRNAVSYSISPGGINLPSALSLDEAAVDRVVAALRPLLVA